MNFEDAVLAHQHAVAWLGRQYACHYDDANMMLIVAMPIVLALAITRLKYRRNDYGQG
jgi:hypothetical protein